MPLADPPIDSRTRKAFSCGLGVAALPEIAAGAVSQTGIVQRPLIGPVAERSIGLVTSRNRSLSPAAAALVGTLKEYLALQGR